MKGLERLKAAVQNADGVLEERTLESLALAIESVVHGNLAKAAANRVDAAGGQGMRPRVVELPWETWLRERSEAKSAGQPVNWGNGWKNADREA